MEENGNVLLETIISGQSEIEHYATNIIYECPNFKHCSTEKHFDYPQDFKDWRDMPQKYRCPVCNLECYQKQVNKSQLRKVLMTEQGESNPIHLTGFIYGNEIQNINPGTKLNLRGTLKSRKRSPKDLTYHRFFDISKYACSDDKPMLPTEE